jgi:hypothetical protein
MIARPAGFVDTSVLRRIHCRLRRPRRTFVAEIDRRTEDEWFRKNERELIEKARVEREKREAERAAKEAAEERKRLKDMHFMKCPKCGHDMKTESLDGVEVDKCTFCEGVYFDAGEFEDLLMKKQEDRRSVVRRILGI